MKKNHKINKWWDEIINKKHLSKANQSMYKKIGKTKY